ncbi:MAG: hypothetical protein ACR2OZ_05045 [Verrucomicrobiales bacterium]
MRIAAHLFLFAAILAAASLEAQKAPDPDLPGTPLPITEIRFDIQLDGVAVQDLAPYLEKALGQPINLIVPPHASEIVLPRLKVHQVTLPELFEALQVASFPKGGNAPSYNFQMASGNIWIFQMLSWVEEPPSPAAAKISRVFSLAPYLGQLKIEDILTTVQTAWKMSGASENPDLKFHEETKLLIASGTPDKLQVIDTVLEALRGSVQSQKEKALEKELSDTKSGVEARMISAELKVQALHNQNAELQALNHKLEAELGRIEAQIKAGADQKSKF